MANAQIPEIAEIDDFDNVVTTLKFPSGQHYRNLHILYTDIWRIKAMFQSIIQLSF